jgi:hypothetical protein
MRMVLVNSKVLSSPPPNLTALVFSGKDSVRGFSFQNEPENRREAALHIQADPILKIKEPPRQEN